ACTTVRADGDLAAHASSRVVQRHAQVLQLGHGPGHRDHDLRSAQYPTVLLDHLALNISHRQAGHLYGSHIGHVDHAIGHDDARTIEFTGGQEHHFQMVTALDAVRAIAGGIEMKDHIQYVAGTQQLFDGHHFGCLTVF